MMKILFMTSDSNNKKELNIFFTIDDLKKSKNNFVNRKKNDDNISIK